jgi:hypothetical protein
MTNTTPNIIDVLAVIEQQTPPPYVSGGNAQIQELTNKADQTSTQIEKS